MSDPASPPAFSGRTEYRTDDPELRQLIEAAFERSRTDARWFAITTVILSPFAVLLALGVLVITIQWFGSGGGHSYRYGADWIVGISAANVIMAFLVLSTAKGHWRSRWVQAGTGVYGLMLVLTYGLDLDTASLIFLAPWALLAIVSLTLISQAHEHTSTESSSVVAALPNLIIGSYRTILQDLRSQNRGGPKIERTIAMLQAVHIRDSALQKRLILAAANRGVDLRRDLIGAKLIREYQDELRLGRSAPPLEGVRPSR